MSYRMKLVAAVAILAGCTAVVQERRVPATATMPFAVKSIPGTVQTCKNAAPECRIVVRIEPPAVSGGPCLAIIDTETIRIKKNTPVNFYLVRSTADTETYTFVSPGIGWTGTLPSADQFAFVQLTTTNSYAAAQWMAGRTKTLQDLGFVPLVLRASDSMLCTGGDPKIANDG